MSPISPANPNAPIATSSVFSRPAALIGGAAVLVALTAIATTLAVREPAADQHAGGAAPMAAMALDGTPAGKAGAEVPAKRMAATAERSGNAAPATTPTAKPVHAQRGTVQAPASPKAASVCAQCGKVESVAAVTQKGEATGLGVVGGAVVGGLVGSQIGGGSGKNVATVLGAVGGGVAGNEVEKRARATTSFQVKVRMDDGSLRTLTQATAPAVGQKVTVEGSTLRLRDAGG